MCRINGWTAKLCVIHKRALNLVQQKSIKLNYRRYNLAAYTESHFNLCSTFSYCHNKFETLLFFRFVPFNLQTHKKKSLRVKGSSQAKCVFHLTTFIILQSKFTISTELSCALISSVLGLKTKFMRRKIPGKNLRQTAFSLNFNSWLLLIVFSLDFNIVYSSTQNWHYVQSNCIPLMCFTVPLSSCHRFCTCKNNYTHFPWNWNKTERNLEFQAKSTLINLSKFVHKKNMHSRDTK